LIGDTSEPGNREVKEARTLCLEKMMPDRPPIDLRSDTVTRPTQGMRTAMATAEVGDDVMHEDPTVRRLQEKTAELLGKEAALFTPSGTMANQIGIGLHTRPGDELICEPTAHVYLWEGGGIARLWGVTARTIEPLEDFLELDDFQGNVRPNDPHYARTRLVCLENTRNRRGGKVHPITAIAEISGWARAHGLAMHLDGARLMNAVVATGIPAAEWARYFDTVSICFSKGLGAPIGSALAGSGDAITETQRLRKVVGGGMRQAGIVAAGALYALENHVERLAEDHENAKLLARVVEQTPGLELESGQVETNLVWITVDPTLGTAREFADRLKAKGVLVSALGAQVIRACTHLDVTRDDILRAIEAFQRVAEPVHS
jgi:threonine aldolase